MLPERPQNPLHERYASRRMARLFTASHRFTTWRRLWITLAECQRELGLPIRKEQLAELRRVADDIDLERVAELERRTRHDVVAHLHFSDHMGVTTMTSGFGYFWPRKAVLYRLMREIASVRRIS